MRGIRIASHHPSLYMARLPKFSKYCCVWRSGAFASASESANVTPVIGCCSMPSTWVGCGIPTMSRIVGPMTGVTFADSLRSEEHTSELQSRQYLVCRLLLEKKKLQ